MRIITSLVAVLLFMAPMAPQAQGLLIVDNPSEPVRLPRPINIWPPHSAHPRGAAASAVSYKIKELDVQARYRPGAQVQVSQSSSTPAGGRWGVVRVPPPLRRGHEQMTLLVDGKEYRPSCSTPRGGGVMYEEIVPS